MDTRSSTRFGRYCSSVREYQSINLSTPPSIQTSQAAYFFCFFLSFCFSFTALPSVFTSISNSSSAAS